MQASSFFAGPQQTPKSIKMLIWIIVITSFLSPILTFGFNHYFNASGPLQWFTLSTWGLKQGWVWQPFTYFFIHSTSLGITLSFLISLCFHLFLLWFAGSEIEVRFGGSRFILFFLGAGAISGIISAAALLLFSSQAVIVGSGPPIYALMMVWAMIHPDLELFFFFVIRVKAKVMIAIFLGIALIMNLSYGQFTPFLADLCGIVWGFVIGRLFWDLPNPYPLNLAFPTREHQKDNDDKIIDISVIKENDEAFMDRMLEKIAQKGELSLTRAERARMQKISNRTK